MLVRILSVLLLAPPFLWCVARGGWPLGLLTGALAALALKEFARLQTCAPPHAALLVGAFLLGAAGAAGPSWLAAALSAAVLAAALPLGFPPIALERVRASNAWMAGLTFYGLPFGLFAALRGGAEGLPVVASLLILIWVQDSGAYFVGTTLGRHRLSPAVSPKKTWEGSVGGLVLAVPAALATFAWLEGSWAALGLGHPAAAPAALVVVAVLAQVGDLVESGIKRAAKVKDSGDLVPGHGGVLDRFDAFATAVLALTVILLVASAL